MNGPKPTRLEITTEFREKPIREVLQWDCFTGVIQDNVIPPDKDGHLIMGGRVWDLRKTDIPVRVQVIPGISKREALILLNKIMERIKKIPADDFSIYSDYGYQESDEVPF